MVQGEMPERYIYKGLNDLFNLHNNKNNLTIIEYNIGVRNIITRIKLKQKSSAIKEVKEKVNNIHKRFQDRIIIEKAKANQIETQSKSFYLVLTLFN
jgi:hypothetical protein